MNKADLEREIASMQETLLLQLDNIVSDVKEVNSVLDNNKLTINDLNYIRDNLESLNNKLEYIESLNKTLK